MKIKGVRQRGENTFQFTVSVNKGNGTYERRYKTHEVTQKFSPKKLEDHLQMEYLKFKSEVLSGAHFIPEKQTLRKYLERWWRDMEQELSPSTLLLYENIVEKRVLPALGDIYLESFNTGVLDDFLSGMRRLDGSDEPLSGSVKQSVYTVLRSVFNHAVKKKVIKENPMTGVTKPKYKLDRRKTVNFYTPEELQKLFSAFDSIPWPWPMYFSLILAGGLRRGEALGLEWQSVDFENNRIDIHQSIVNAKGGSAITGTKSITSERFVSLPHSVMDDLKTYRKLWIQRKLQAGDNWIEKDRQWVFCNINGTHYKPPSATFHWRKLVEFAGVHPIRLHDLRHTSATLLIAQGVHAKTISERLGHSSIRITMDVYGHVMQSADQAAADALDFIFQKEGNNERAKS